MAAVEAGCKGNAMGVLFCLFHQSGLWDWDTGQTVREISHKDLGKAMGNLSYNTIRKAVTELRHAGILGYADYRGKGVKWSDGSGHANRYKLLIPPLDPPQNLGTPLPKKRADPYPKNVHHYTYTTTIPLISIRGAQARLVGATLIKRPLATLARTMGKRCENEQMKCLTKYSTTRTISGKHGRLSMIF